MEQDLVERIDQLVARNPSPHDRAEVEAAAEAFERRFRSVFSDLGLDVAEPTVSVEFGQRVVRFPVLDGRRADRLLRRLEDIRHALPSQDHDHAVPSEGQLAFEG